MKSKIAVGKTKEYQYLKKYINIELNPIKILDNYTYGSSFIINWKGLNCNHTYSRSILEQVRSESRCPKCPRNGKITVGNLPKYDYLKDYVDSHKNSIEILDNYTYGSEKKVYWKGINCNHTYYRSIKDQIKYDCRCPKCSIGLIRSMIEIKILFELKYFFPELQTLPTKIGNYYPDFFIESIKTIIEYDGSFFHKEKIKTDIEKYNYYTSNGYISINIREGNLEKVSDNDIKISNISLDNNNSIKKLVVSILERLNVNKEIINNYLNHNGLVNLDKYKNYILYDNEYKNNFKSYMTDEEINKVIELRKLNYKEEEIRKLLCISQSKWNNTIKDFNLTKKEEYVKYIFSENDINDIIQYRKELKTEEYIAKIYNCSRSVINDLLKKYNLSGNIKIRKVGLVKDNKIIEVYKSPTEVGRLFNLNRKLITKYANTDMLVGGNLWKWVD